MSPRLVPIAITTSTPCWRYSRADGWPPRPSTPRESGWFSGNTPLPFGVVATGQPSRSATVRRRVGASSERTPLPTSISGRLAVDSCSMISSSTSTATRPPIVMLPPIRGGEICAVVTSSGRVIITGPLRPDIAVAIARRARCGSVLGCGTSSASLVTWLAISTICRPCAEPSCSTPLPWAWRGTSPTRSRTGTPSHHALASPVIALSTPGPEVTATTASLPVARACAAAANIAPLSCRVVIVRMLLSSRASWTGEIAPPGIPNTTSTPASSSMPTSRSAPRMVWAGGWASGASTGSGLPSNAVTSIGLATARRAPAACARAASSSLIAALASTTSTSRVSGLALIRRQASTPSRPGMKMSITTRSGRSVPTASIASIALSATISSISSWPRSRRCRARSWSPSSSTTSTRIGRKRGRGLDSIAEAEARDIGYVLRW